MKVMMVIVEMKIALQKKMLLLLNHQEKKEGNTEKRYHGFGNTSSKKEMLPSVSSVKPLYQ